MDRIGKWCRLIWPALLAVSVIAAGCGRVPARQESGTALQEAASAAEFEGGATAEPEGGGTAPGQTERRLRVAATIFPYYDFVRQIAGDLVELELVVPAGMDSHSFEPTPADMRVIREADVLIANGGAMEQWVSRVLEAVDAPELTVVTMMGFRRRSSRAWRLRKNPDRISTMTAMMRRSSMTSMSGRPRSTR